MNAVITKRLIIRRPKKTDLQNFLAYRNDADNLKFQPIVKMTEEAALTLLAKQMFIDEKKETGWVMFAIELKNKKRMIGEVGIYISADGISNGDLGWSIHKEDQGNGYALEAAEVLLAYAFKQRKLQQVTATCVAVNTASVMLMKRLGMRREMKRNQNQFIDGVRYDEHLYKISRDEWSMLKITLP